MTTANQIASTRLLVVAAEYLIATQKEQLDTVVGIIAGELATSPNDVMEAFRSEIEQLKMKESLLKMVNAGLMTEKDGGYKLTVIGEVYAKTQIKNDPKTREFYKKLLRSHGVDPQTDPLTSD